MPQNRMEGGGCDSRRTGGFWTAEEAMLHVNCFELRAALFVLQSLYMAYKNTHIRLLSDNCATVTCINKSDSTTEKCNEVTREVWLWCIKMNNFVPAVHLPGSKTGSR